MGTAFWLQFLGSTVAIAVIVGVVAWLGMPRDGTPLDGVKARDLLLEEFPDAPIGALWVAPDGQSALAQAGDEVLIVYRVGDGCVIRSAPRRAVDEAVVGAGQVVIRLDDVAAPKVRIALAAGAAWPPESFAHEL